MTFREREETSIFFSMDWAFPEDPQAQNIVNLGKSYKT